MRNKYGQFVEGHRISWKGDAAGYVARHQWIAKMAGKPNKCQGCGTTKAKRYEWANISGEHKRDISDYVRLCQSCHIYFDGKTKLNPQKVRLARILNAAFGWKVAKIHFTFKGAWRVSRQSIDAAIKKQSYPFIS